MHLLLTACGSYGDVLPMVGLAASAIARGHSATIVTNPHFRPIVEQAGAQFVPLGTAEEYEQLARHPDLWHPLKGPKLVLGYGGSGLLRKLYDAIAAHYRPGETVIGAHGLDLASRVFQEKHDATLATIHFAPLSIRSLQSTPRFFGLLASDAAPKWLKAAQFWLADRAIVDPLISPAMDPLRKELGLAPVRRYYDGWANSRQLVLGLFPEWFAAPQRDWPPNTALTGFPLWNPGSTDALPEPVEQFLADHEPPIVFAPGSANTQATSFFQTAVDVCQRMQRPGILLTKYAEHLPTSLPDSVARFDFVPFRALLPRAAALVHHGGVGSCAQGFAAGVPQLAMPMAYDQLDNGARLRALGVGDMLSRKKFRPERVQRDLARLLSSPHVQRRCAELATQCDGPASLESACDLLENLLANRRRKRNADQERRVG